MEFPTLTPETCSTGSYKLGPPIYARKLRSLTGPKSSTPPVLCVISLALHGSTALSSEVVPRRCIVLIELHRLQVAGLQGSGTGGDDLAPWLHVDFQPSISLTEMGFFKPPRLGSEAGAANGFRVAKL